jgi:membrane protease YdiL (CAAX protease family)
MNSLGSDTDSGGYRNGAPVQPNQKGFITVRTEMGSQAQRLALDSPIIRLWKRTPTVVRELVVGFVVFEIGVVAWLAIAALIPAPWSIVVMSAILWVYWRYFSGNWWPRSTTGARSDRFRSTKMPATVWKWSLVAALLFVVAVQSGFVMTFRIIEFPAEAFAAGYSFGDVPIWAAWLFIIMASLVAGICEEIGFRGYMQVPLEKRYGPAPSLVIVSMLFVLLHLNQAWAPPILLHIFAISVMLGVLAYASGSLIPGIIGHTVMDIPSFAYWWTDVAGTFDKRPIAETGVDAHSVLWSLVFVASIALFCWAARKTLVARRGKPE